MKRSRIALVIAVCSCMVACDRPSESVRASSAVPRVASFSPALTAMMTSLGLESTMVGRSAFCRIDPTLPVVGDLHEVDYERLVRLDPTHILVQSQPDRVDPGLVDISRRRGWQLLASPLAGVEDIRTAFTAIPDHLFEAGAEEHRRCAAMVREYTDRIDAALTPPIPGVEDTTVLILSPMEPPLAWGIGTWMDDMLVSLGGRNALQAHGWVALGWEDLIRIEADRIVFVSESAIPCDGTLQSMLARRSRATIDVLVHPEVHLPATCTDEIASRLRAVLEQEQGP